VGELSKIDPNRFKMKCSVCHQVSGACIQCYMKGCYTPFHASCSRYKGNYMAERVTWDHSHPEAPVPSFPISIV